MSYVHMTLGTPGNRRISLIRITLHKAFFVISEACITVRMGYLILCCGGADYSPSPPCLLQVTINNLEGPEESIQQITLLLFPGYNRAFLTDFQSQHHQILLTNADEQQQRTLPTMVLQAHSWVCAPCLHPEITPFQNVTILVGHSHM